MEFRLLVRGDRACFKRPEFAEDVVSYDMMTPHVANGLLGRIHGARDSGWRLVEIRILQPIRSTWMFLVEIEAGNPGDALPVRIAGPADRRMANVLSDVAYLLTWYVGGDDAAQQAMRCRERIAAGHAARMPYLGVPRFPAEVAVIDPTLPPPASALAGTGMIDLGWTMFDRSPRSGNMRFFRPTMIDGVIDLRRAEALILAG